MPEMPAACPATGPGKPVAPIPGRGFMLTFPGLGGDEHPWGLGVSPSINQVLLFKALVFISQTMLIDDLAGFKLDS